ncbi:hypothetical protein DFH27DRAFT_26031 [Peziza echinospora]|nr:hypothetical protein DFH27DRAFT_26031 [Peziza echinospora]
MAMVNPLQPAPHPDSLEWSRYMAALFMSQNDRSGSLQQYRQFIPDFVLQSFCTTDRLKVQQSAGSYYGDDANEEADTLVIYDPKTMRFDKRHWSECFGEANIYERHFDNLRWSTWQRDQWRPFETVQRLDTELFSAMNAPAWQIQQQHATGSGKILLRRSDINTLRKFMYLLTSLKNRDRNQHLLAKDPSMEDARVRRKKFMEMNKLDHPRDLWLNNAEWILDTPHYNITTEADIFDLDREDYRANARDRFVVFWEAGPGEEFVLTDNAFGCFEGGGLGARKKLTIKMTAREHEQRIYTRDFMWHQLFVLSPKLVMALCHGSLVNPALAKAQRRSLGLRNSLLESLPHPIANNYYKDMTKGEAGFLKQGWEVPAEVERLFGAPRWDGKVIAIENREMDELAFQVSPLTAQQVSLVNCVLLQNQTSSAPVQSVSFRPPTSYRSLHDSLVEFENTKWTKYTDEKQNTYTALQKRLSQYLSKLEDVRSVSSSVPAGRPAFNILATPTVTPEPNPMMTRKPEGPPPPKAETVLTSTTMTNETKRERKRPQENHRFEQGLPTPPVTQPHSRESSMPPQPPLHHNMRTPASSVPPPAARAVSSERPMPVENALPTPQRSRAPSSDRATTTEVPSRRANITAQLPPIVTQNLQPQAEKRRPASTERRYSMHDGIRVEPIAAPPVPPMPELKREQHSRASSTQPAMSQAPRPTETPVQISVSSPTGSHARRFSVANPPQAQSTPENRRPPSMERRYTESRADSTSRAHAAEKRQAASSAPVPEAKVPEVAKLNVEKVETRHTSPSPARPVLQTAQSSPATTQTSSATATQTPAVSTQPTAEAERTENPKLSSEILQHIEKQRQLEQQRAEQERVAIQQKAEQERLDKQRAELQKAEQQRLEQQRLERQRAEQQRIERAEKHRLEEQQRRLEQQRKEDQRRAEQLKLEQQRAEQQRLEIAMKEQQKLIEQQQRVAEQERQRRNIEQVRLEQQQHHQMQTQRAVEQRQESYNRSRERSLSSHASHSPEVFRIDQSRFDSSAAFERQSQMSEVSVSSNASGSSGSSGSSGNGSGPGSRDSSRDSDRTERTITIRGGSASPKKRSVEAAPRVNSQPRENVFANGRPQLKFLQIPFDQESSLCDVAESMIVEVDDEEVWVDEGYAEAPQQLELFPKPRKNVVRFASPKPKRFDPQSPVARKASIMGLNSKVRYAGHVQQPHAQHTMQPNQPHGNAYAPRREY